MFVFLDVGCFRDAIPAIIIVGTTLLPLSQSVGMHPVSFAMIIWPDIPLVLPRLIRPDFLN